MDCAIHGTCQELSMSVSVSLSSVSVSVYRGKWQVKFQFKNPVGAVVQGRYLAEFLRVAPPSPKACNWGERHHFL